MLHSRKRGRHGPRHRGARALTARLAAGYSGHPGTLRRRDAVLQKRPFAIPPAEPQAPRSLPMDCGWCFPTWRLLPEPAWRNTWERRNPRRRYRAVCSDRTTHARCPTVPSS